MPGRAPSPIFAMFDVIVIGVGSMGSSCCYFLAKRGYKVLGIDQFEIPHELGSHTGQSRIIRKAYFEHPDYVPLLSAAYQNWRDFETESSNKLYYQTGLVYFGRPGSEIIKGVKLAASLYDIPLQTLDEPSAKRQFPQFVIQRGYETLFEPDAGFVIPEKTIKLYAEHATKNGATIHTNEKVLDWKREGGEIAVTTDKGFYRCRKLIITAGAWSGKMIPGLKEKISVTRQTATWVKPGNKNDYSLGNFPCWMIADEDKPGCYYGFPVLPAEFGKPEGLKLAYHYPALQTDPDNVNRHVLATDVTDLLRITKKYIRGSVDSVVETKTCLYGNSPDENFIIDKLPGHEEQVIIACGFSGHGFKFVPVVGEILADLAIEGKTKHPIGFLSARRFDK